MQSYTDLKLKCGDCKNTLTSAALLLQHFAQHIREQHESDHKLFGKRKYTHCRLLSKKKKKNSIIENMMKVFDPTLSGSEPSPSCGTDSSTISAFSDFLESSSDNSSLLQGSLNSSKSPKGEENYCSSDGNVRKKCQPPLSLVRFDLQQRLENCVMNLSNKKNEILNNNTFKPEKFDLCQNIKKEIKEEGETEINTSRGINEEFNPLKFCMITMEENKESMGGKVREIKKISSRKQLIPKKIEHSMRKLAPKPDSIPKNCDDNNIKLSQKKKYPCNLCSKVFGWSTDLKRHILVHTGERPFKCKTCFASFTRNFLLQKHQSKVHPCSPPKKTLSSPVETKVLQNSHEISRTDGNVQKQIVMIKNEKSESDDDIDEDRLIITESFEDDIDNFKHVFRNTLDSKWTTNNNSTHRRYSDIEHSDMFAVGKMKVVTM